MAAAASPVTVEEVKAHLAGLDPWFTAAQAGGAAYGESRIATRIPQLIRQFEIDTQFRITPAQIICNPDGTYDNVAGVVLQEDAYPYYPQLAGAEFLVTTLYKRPVRAIQRVRVMLGPTTTVITLPSQWYRVDRRTGRFWIVPYQGPATLIINQVDYAIAQVTFGGRDQMPATLAFDYTVGLVDQWWDGTAQPSLSYEWSALKLNLEKYCALQVLKDISQTFDAGLVGKSVGADGASQSWNYDRFQGRMDMLTQDIMNYQESLRQQETPLLMTSV